MNGNTIVETLNGAVLEITLNRPAQLNSFNEDMHKAFHNALIRARDDDDVRAVLLTGTGRGFCAGQDLGDRNPDTMDTPPDLEHTISEFYNPVVRLIRSISKPIICAVNGVAAGAGANLALACDIVFAAKSAKFIQSFVKVGLVPDAGGSWVLPRLIGEARAKALAMTAQPLFAEQAQEWGLIWSAVDDDMLLTEARDMAQSLSKGATFGIGLTKDAIQQAANHSLDAHLELEAKYQGRAGRTNDYAEGIRAFLQKRTPQFKGQ